MKALVLSCIFMFTAYFSYSQGHILSVIPGSGSPGQEMDVVIQATGTNFQAGKTTVMFGDGNQVLVTKVEVRTRETVVAHVKVAPTAANGGLDISVNTIGMSAITGPGMFEVFSLGQSVTATLDIIPVQNIFLTDFDPNNLQSAPLLFMVTVYNDMTPGKIRVDLSLSGEYYGDIATARKELGKVEAGKVIRLDNKQFDYSLASGGSNFAQAAFQSGTFPADLYSYKVRILKDNVLVQEIEGTNTITNQVAKPEIISPGSEVGNAPEPLRSKLPLLQWFSQLPMVDVTMYAVQDGQTSAQEISQNRPVWQQKGITQSSFLYPASAEVLEEGKVYAWQVVGKQSGSRGAEYFPSEMHWFKVQNSAPVTSPVVQLQVEPQELSLLTGQTQNFTVTGFDADSKEVPVKVKWRIIPSDAGTIDANGVFTAGKLPKTVAVIADSEGIQDYGTVTVKVKYQDAQEWMMDNFLKQLFGIQPN